MSNASVSLVQSLYAAFGRGDIAAIISASAPNVDWCVVGRKADYPTLGEWKGANGVAQFFQAVAELEEFQDFSPREFCGSGDKVFALGVYRFTLKETGRAVASEWCQVFTIIQWTRGERRGNNRCNYVI